MPHVREAPAALLPTAPSYDRDMPGRAVSPIKPVRTALMILRRSVTRREPSAASRSRASSQWPYSAWSVSKRVAAPRLVPRGR